MHTLISFVKFVNIKKKKALTYKLLAKMKNSKY